MPPKKSVSFGWSNRARKVTKQQCYYLLRYGSCCKPGCRAIHNQSYPRPDGAAKTKKRVSRIENTQVPTYVTDARESTEVGQPTTRKGEQHKLEEDSFAAELAEFINAIAKGANDC